MFRSSLLLSPLLAMLLVTACGNDASDMQKTANKAQSEADAKIAETNKVVGDSVGQAQKEADAKIADATAKGDQAIRTAQAEADVKIAAQRADFTALREDFRHATTIRLAALDQKVAEHDARALKANGAKKADLEAKLRMVHAQRDAFAADYATLDNESAVTWDATKARLDRELAELDARVAAV